MLFYYFPFADGQTSLTKSSMSFTNSFGFSYNAKSKS